MTCAVLNFPTPPGHTPCRREAIVTAARAILRSPALHCDADLTEACVAIRDWADPTTDWADHLLADIVLRTIETRKRRKRQDAAQAAIMAHRGMIRSELIRSLVFAGFAVAVVVVGLAL